MGECPSAVHTRNQQEVNYQGGKNLNYKLRITLDSERKDNYLMKRNNSLKTFNFRKQSIQKC